MEAAEDSRRECWPAASHCCSSRAWPRPEKAAAGKVKLGGGTEGILMAAGGEVGEVEEAGDSLAAEGGLKGDEWWW